MRLLVFASLLGILAACDGRPAADKPPVAASLAVDGSGFHKVTFPVPASTSDPGSVEQVCQTIRYHEMTYFRDLIDAANLRHDDGRKAVITSFVAALKAQRSRTDSIAVQGAVDKYLEDLEYLLDVGNIGALNRGHLTLACRDREVGIAIDRKPFHHVTDPAIRSDIQAGCAQYVPVMEKHIEAQNHAFTAVRTEKTEGQADPEAQRLRDSMRELSELDLRLAGAARDHDLQAAWKLQAQLLADALAEGTTAKRLVGAEALLGEEFAVVDQVLQRYCGTKGR